MPHLSVSLLGLFQACLDREPVTSFDTLKARALLAYLADDPGRPHARSMLAGILWPERTESAALSNLRHTLAVLRAALHDPAARPPFLLIDRETIAFNPRSDCTIDTLAFRQLIAAFQDAGPLAPEQLDCLEQAVAIYRGDFLEAFALDDSAAFEEWLLLRREHYRSLALDALERLAEAALLSADYERAKTYARRQIALEPWREAAHRQLMRTLALCGQRTAALAQYEACRRSLAEELDIEPSEATTQLFEQIRTERIGEAAVGTRKEPAPQEDRLPFTRPARPKHNLPSLFSSFIGRESEMAFLADLIASGNYRLVTLTGAGGIGKTRLALQVAAGLVEDFEHGVWQAELARLTDPARVAATVAALFGLREEMGQSVEETLHNYLRERRLLLVLDNCEHLIGAVAGFAEALLQAAPQVKVLATSREALGLTGERVYLVPPLATPDADQIFSLERLTQYDAVQLFLERVCGAQPAFTLTDANASRVAQICGRLDGIPLAIELAAGRMRLLSAEQIATRLDDRFRLLTGGSRTALPRHQTLQAAIDWSYDLLSEPERALLRQLSVFVGGWTLEAAEGVCACGSPGEFEVLDGLASLVDKSLVEVQVNAGEAHRYRMLETVRHYAQEKLSAGGEDRSARNRHLAYFAAFAEDMDRKVHTPDYHTGLAQLDAEMDNFRAALGWGLGAEQRSKAEDWLCLAAALGWYWHLRELEIEGYDWLSRGLECLPEEPAPSVHLRAMACYWAAWLGERICVPPLTWLQFSRRSVSLCRQAGDRLGLAFALPFYGDALANVSPNLPYPRDYAAGLALIEEGIALNQELGTPWTLGVAYMAKARRTWQKEDNSDSRALYEKCIACFEQAGDVLSSALVKVELAFTALHHGDYETAQKNSMDLLELCRSEGLIYDRMLDLPGLIAYFQNDFARMDQYLREALSISKERGYYINRITWLTRMLGVAALLKGQIQRARQLFLESWAQGCKLKSGDRYGDPGSELALILWIGTLAERLGQPAQAARFLGAVESVLETFFKPLSTWDDLEYERVTDRVRTQLDEASLAVAWEAGRALTLEQALAEALAFCREAWAP